MLIFSINALCNAYLNENSGNEEQITIKFVHCSFRP